ncbi:MAG: hypothetical protein R3D58_15545 [Saprospiraceae bacterium]
MINIFPGINAWAEKCLGEEMPGRRNAWAEKCLNIEMPGWRNALMETVRPKLEFVVSGEHSLPIISPGLQPWEKMDFSPIFAQYLTKEDAFALETGSF